MDYPTVWMAVVAPVVFPCACAAHLQRDKRNGFMTNRWFEHSPSLESQLKRFRGVLLQPQIYE